MRRRYVGIIERGEEPGYSIFFPDFPGCGSAGDSIEETVEMGQEALTGHIAVMAEYGDPIPDPTPLDKIEVDADVQEVVRVLIEVGVPGRVKRINITMDENLIEEIDRVAGEGKRSAFLADAARHALAAQRLA
ncbi:type II toxin-antitoxin system HicB family antitoxin [Telmatospirillum sp. J64-1]|uniref:type II toxin-antitoxin system HicB family antitoxin n=1 Tax=Telmatospirillum sp. J64-1 TaxID=2502183 RepID=UPI00115D31BD|nr:type II toxin-antitoxin system HicB family antitoxin [Telmatospirillum sp. J64-1]